jgi:hypothetical protein
MLDYFISSFPESIVLTNMNVKSQSIKVTGDAINPQHLQSFYLLLKKDNKFKDVRFENIKKTDIGYDFILLLDKFSTT